MLTSLSILLHILFYLLIMLSISLPMIVFTLLLQLNFFFFNFLLRNAPVTCFWRICGSQCWNLGRLKKWCRAWRSWTPPWVCGSLTSLLPASSSPESLSSLFSSWHSSLWMWVPLVIYIYEIKSLGGTFWWEELGQKQKTGMWYYFSHLQRGLEMVARKTWSSLGLVY